MSYEDPGTGERNAVSLKPPVTQQDWHDERGAVDAVMDDIGGIAIRVDARPAVDRALDGRPLATVPVAGEPRPMLLGIARLVTLEPTRVIVGFVEHCRAQLSEAGGR